MNTEDPIGLVEYTSSLMRPIRLSFDIRLDDDVIHYTLFNLPEETEPWYGLHESKVYGSGMLPLSNVVGEKDATLDAVATALCKEIGIQKSFTIENIRRNYVDLHVPEFVRRSLIQPNHPVESPTPERVKAYVLFADIRGFSTWSLLVSLDEVTKVFEEISERVVQMLIDYHYDYWKLLGDGIMLVWEVKGNETLAADNAIGAAFELHRKCGSYWKDTHPSLPQGIGAAICGGDIVKYASATFFESVIITDYLGPIVNFAARLQTLAKPNEVLVNKRVAEHSKFHWYTFEDISRSYEAEIQKLKGIPDSERSIYRVKDKYFNND